MPLLARIGLFETPRRLDRQGAFISGVWKLRDWLACFRHSVSRSWFCFPWFVLSKDTKMFFHTVVKIHCAVVDVTNASVFYFLESWVKTWTAGNFNEGPSNRFLKLITQTLTWVHVFLPVRTFIISKLCKSHIFGWKGRIIWSKKILGYPAAA